jgi:AAA15 family ATPase/GTPase
MIKFSIKNFRIFKEKQDFEFKPLTLLVGPNNSGKSTVYKSLKLIKESSSPFSIPRRIDTTLGSNNDNSILNDKNKPLELFFEIPLLDEIKLDLQLEYVESSLSKFILGYKNTPLILMTWEKDGFSNTDFSLKIKNSGINLGVFKKIINLYLTKKIKSLSSELEQFEKVWGKWKDMEDDFGFYSSQIEDFQQELKKITNTKNSLKHDFFEYVLDDNLLSLNDEDLHIFTKALSDTYELIDFEKISKISNNNDYLNKAYKAFRNENNINEIESFTKFYGSLLKAILEKKITNNIKSGKVEKTNFYDYLTNDFIPIIEKQINDSIHHFSKIQKVPSTKTLNNKYFMFNEHSDNFLNKIAKEIFVQYDRPNLDRSGINFIEHWLKKFKIGTEIIPKKLSNDIGELYIKDFSNNEINIFDMGFGVSQIISIVALPLLYFNSIEDYLNSEDKEIGGHDYIHSYNSPFIYLEEPETNLHPNWQSLLIELLVEMKRTFGINFLIETHSEYMIRKLQNLVALNKIDASEIALYYINSDEAVNKTEPKVKKIIIREDGILANSFGPGFFDEATRLTIDLLTVKNYN